MGIDSRRADDMELFEVACAFGIHRPADEAEAGGEAAPKEEWDPIKERAKAHQEGRAAPKAPPRGYRPTAPPVTPHKVARS
jgi:hypothetical protein